MYTVRFQHDADHTLETPHGTPLPGTPEEYAGYEFMRDGRPVPYEEYCRTWGDPDRHVVLGAVLERHAPCCEHCGHAPAPEHAASLWGIDFMDTDPEAFVPLDRPLPVDSPEIVGYLREVVDDLVQEAEA